MPLLAFSNASLHSSRPEQEIAFSWNCSGLISSSFSVALAELAKDGVNVRFIELMPIGQGKEKHTLKEAEVKHILSETYGTIRPCVEKLGSGPAHYMEIDGFEGKIGFISAISHKFCSGCNRVRMTADGFLKPCLQYETGMDLRTLLRDGVSDAELKAQIEMTITQKPKCHHFASFSSFKYSRLIALRRTRIGCPVLMPVTSESMSRAFTIRSL